MGKLKRILLILWVVIPTSILGAGVAACLTQTPTGEVVLDVEATQAVLQGFSRDFQNLARTEPDQAVQERLYDISAALNALSKLSPVNSGWEDAYYLAQAGVTEVYDYLVEHDPGKAQKYRWLFITSLVALDRLANSY